MIPAMALGAAVNAWRETPMGGDPLMNALEAAAPYMLEQAHTDGYCDGMSGDQHKVDQYRPTK